MHKYLDFPVWWLRNVCNISQKVEKSFCISLPLHILHHSLSLTAEVQSKGQNLFLMDGVPVIWGCLLEASGGDFLMQPYHCCILPALPPDVLWALHLFCVPSHSPVTSRGHYQVYLQSNWWSQFTYIHWYQMSPGTPSAHTEISLYHPFWAWYELES